MPFTALALAATLAAPASSEPTYYPMAQAKAPFSEAVRAGGFLFLSGQIGAGKPGDADPVKAASKNAMDKIAAALMAHGSSMDDVVSCTVMLADMKNWPAFNEVYVRYFKPDRLPSRSAFGANGLAMNAPLEVSCIAYAPLSK